MNTLKDLTGEEIMRVQRLLKVCTKLAELIHLTCQDRDVAIVFRVMSFVADEFDRNGEQSDVSDTMQQLLIDGILEQRQ